MSQYVTYLVEDALLHGLTKAIIIQRIRFWCEYHKKRNECFNNGVHWSGYLSNKELSNQTGIPTPTVGRNLRELVQSGILIRGNFNKKSYDATGWYTLNQIDLTTHQNDSDPNQNDVGSNQNDSDPNQNDSTIPGNTPINTLSNPENQNGNEKELTVQDCASILDSRGKFRKLDYKQAEDKLDEIFFNFKDWKTKAYGGKIDWLVENHYISNEKYSMEDTRALLNIFIQ